MQYADYAGSVNIWEPPGRSGQPESLNSWLTGEQELAGLPEVVSLPTGTVPGHPAPSYRGDGVELRIDPQTWAGCQGGSRKTT